MPLSFMIACGITVAGYLKRRNMFSFIITGIAVIAVFSMVILVHECGHFFVARRMGVKVERFALGLGRVLVSKKVKGTEYALCLIPFGGYVKMAGDEPSGEVMKESYKYFGQAPGRRFWIIFAGAGLNYLLAFVIFCFVVPTAKVGLVVKDMPAYKAGIESGDKILSINGNRTEYWYQVLDTVSSNRDATTALRFQLERKGETLEAVVIPEAASEAPARKVRKIGISSYGDVRFLKAAPGRYIITGMKQTLSNTLLTYKFIWYLITGKIALKGSATGPVGIAVIIGRAINIGLAYLLYLIAHINLALAIFNLLPLPVLDGGHILLLGIERIMKRPVSVKVQEVIQYVAIFFITLLFATVTWNDITTWIIKK